MQDTRDIINSYDGDMPLGSDDSPSHSITVREKEPESSSSPSLQAELISEDDDLTDFLACLLEPCHSTRRKYPKRIRFRRRANPFPRVLKVDIRRKYPIMFINVINSCDPKLMGEFFTQFCMPDCQLSDSILHPITKQKTEVFNRSGVSEIVKFTELCVDAPDFIMQLKHAYIKQSNMYSGSKVVLQVSAKASSLTHFFEAVALSPEKLQDMHGVVDALEKKFHTKEHTYGKAGFLGSVVICLDAQNRFEKLDMEADFFLSK